MTNFVGWTVDDSCVYITNRKLSFKIIGNGSVVTGQVPASGSRLSVEKGVIYLYTGDELPSDTVSVPDVVGKTASACNRLIVNAKLNIKIEGAQNYDEGSGAVVVSQSPAAGTVVPPGTIVTVEFMHLDSTD